MLDVVGSLPHQSSVIPEQSESLIASLAEQASYDVAFMAMVDGERDRLSGPRVDVALRLLAEEAGSVLFLEHRSVTVDRQAVLLQLEPFGSCVSLDLQAWDAVRHPAAGGVVAPVEAVDRLDGVAFLAALVRVDAVMAVPVVLAVVAPTPGRQVLVLAVSALPDGGLAGFEGQAGSTRVLLPSAVVGEIGQQLGQTALGAPSMPLSAFGADLLNLHEVPCGLLLLVEAVANLADVGGCEHEEMIAAGNRQHPEVGGF